MFTEDLSAFFDAGEFADVASVAPAGGGSAFNLTGIYDSKFVEGEIAGMHLETGMAVFRVKSADCVTTGIDRSDVMTVKGKTFDVVKVEPDGIGTAVVILAPKAS